MSQETKIKVFSYLVSSKISLDALFVKTSTMVLTAHGLLCIIYNECSKQEMRTEKEGCFLVTSNIVSRQRRVCYLCTLHAQKTSR